MDRGESGGRGDGGMVPKGSASFPSEKRILENNDQNS